MNEPPERGHPISEAMEWVARIFAAVVFMIVPGLAGQWLDRKLGTAIFVFLGFGFGLFGGLWYLIVITNSASKSRQQNNQDEGESKP